jgi:hypothetical protein
MAEKKPGIERLSQDDLKSVKAGLPPYESPEIVDLSTLSGMTCDTGKSCVDGNSGVCGVGIECRAGKQVE